MIVPVPWMVNLRVPVLAEEGTHPTILPITVEKIGTNQVVLTMTLAPGVQIGADMDVAAALDVPPTEPPVG